MPQLEKKPIVPHPGEPVFVFRAKDDIAMDAIKAYRAALLKYVNYSEDSDIIISIDQWIERANAWRRNNPDKCQPPTF